jgi:hypothetical protein
MSLATHEQHQARVARDLISAANGLEAASEFAGVKVSQLSRYQSPHDHDSITLRAIEALEAVTHGKAGHPIATRYLAARAGYALVRLPDGVATGVDMLELVGQQAKESGDITSRVIAALADKKIDDDEIDGIRIEIADLIRVAVAMDAELEILKGSR